MMEESEYDKVKKEIRSVLIAYQGGVSFREFVNSYERFIGQKLPTRVFGYSTDIELLQSMPDVVRVVLDKNNKHILFCVADETTAHIQELVNRQRPRKPKCNSKSENNRVPLFTVFHGLKKNYECLPFIPGPLRAEICKLMMQYQDGISISSFVVAYQKTFNKNLPLENGLESLIRLVKSLPELEIREINNDKKIFLNESYSFGLKLHSKEASKRPTSDTAAFHNGGNASDMLDISGISSVAKCNFQKVLNTCPNGILATHFPPLYEKVTGKMFDLHAFGYTTMLQLVDSLPDVFIRKQSPDNKNDWILLPATTQETKDKCNSSSPKCNAEIQKEKCIQNIRNLLLSHPEGITLSAFPHFYNDIFNIPVPYKEFGYDSFEMFISSISGVVPLKVQVVEGMKIIYLTSMRGGPFGEKMTPSSKLFSEEFHPADAASSTVQYVYSEIPWGSEKYFPVYVSAIINPSVFWFQLQHEEARFNLTRLEKVLSSFYKSYDSCKYKMRDSDIMIGASCVAFNPTDDFWFRGVIKAIPTPETVNVSCVDYGSWQNIPRSELRYVKNSFMTLPAQAFRARLACVKPTHNASQWSAGAQKKFLQLCTNVLMAEIYSVKNETLAISLCDTNGEEDLHISIALIDEGYAELCPEDNFSYDSSPLLTLGTPSKDINIPSKDINTPSKDISTPSKDSKAEMQKNVILPKRLFNEAMSEKNSSSYQHTAASCKKYFKRLKLGDGHKAHIVVVNKMLYVPEGDLCELFWTDKHPEFLAQQLKSEGITIPTMRISSDCNKEVFYQLERYSLQNTKAVASGDSTIKLYPLTYVIQILNLFGHPSIHVRETFLNELRKFSSKNLIHQTFSDDEDDSMEDMQQEPVNKIEDKLKKMCLYDLKAMRKSVKSRRSNLVNNGDTSVKEMKKIEHLQSLIEKTIADIEDICSTYSIYA